jgi:putative membrane protein
VFNIIETIGQQVKATGLANINDEGETNMSKATKDEQYVPTSSRSFAGLIVTVSIVANIIILLLFFSPIGYQGEVHFDLSLLPRMNAIFNSFTFIFLLGALFAILRKNVKVHKALVLAAFASTLLFLITYLTFHYISPETAKFGGQGIVRPIYFFILITHSVLAAIIVPLALFSVVWGWTMQVQKHRKIARWTMPIWLYVSFTGVLVYLFMAPYY